MCRLAAYLGPPLSLGQFLLAPKHGLLLQSYAPREMHEGHVNVDGYGVGWLATNGELAHMTHSIPIWADHNLATLGRNLTSSLWVASVRNATTGLANHPANTQPYLTDGLLFLHNGSLANFPVIRTAMRRMLAPEIENSIEGTTDSEYLFALLRQMLRGTDFDPRETLRELAQCAVDQLGVERALMNIIVTDGERLYALRHAINAPSPTLYFTSDDEDYPGATLIASEPTTDGAYWQPIPEHHILTIDANKPAELISL
ncbi:MAG: ergothioneine biosynthesis protein EgtC [Acidiferrobacter sp.]